MTLIRGFLKIVVLNALAESPKSGYALMKFIEEKTGSKPSPGSMYPLLDVLKADGLVAVKGVGRSKEYTLTALGKEKLRSVKDDSYIGDFVSGLRMISSLTPFRELSPEWDDFHMLLFDMMKNPSNAAKIKRILARTVRELQ